MARRYSASQIQSMLRQAQQKQRQAINKYNQEVRRFNQQRRTAINNYNQAVRAYNARVRAHRQRILNELTRLSQQSITTKYVVYRSSVQTLHHSYQNLEAQAELGRFGPAYNGVLDLSERETANSLEVANRLLGHDADADISLNESENTELLQRLGAVCPDLLGRWNGAVFALNPRNPDAARHFCTSAREVITQIIESAAPDEEVMQSLPLCNTTDQGKPTRRSKIRYLLQCNGMTEEALEEFVENDMENIVQLFRLLNDGTHGSSGTFDLSQLRAIKKRVEDGIFFLTELTMQSR